MKYLILIAIIYGIYRITQTRNLIEANKREKLNQEKDTGFTDYEEVEE